MKRDDAAAAGQEVDQRRVVAVADEGLRRFRDLLRVCREDGTGVAIIRTPESTTFRAAYRPDALAILDAYTADLCREFGVKVIDARQWLPDEQFEDGHHPLLAGQAAFTSRLQREVLVPLVTSSTSGQKN